MSDQRPPMWPFSVNLGDPGDESDESNELVDVTIHKNALYLPISDHLRADNDPEYAASEVRLRWWWARLLSQPFLALRGLLDAAGYAPDVRCPDCGGWDDL